MSRGTGLKAVGSITAAFLLFGHLANQEVPHAHICFWFLFCSLLFSFVVCPKRMASIVPDESTIDESVLKTIGRDLMTIARNLRTVLIPINWKFTAQEQALRNWDLWGPLASI
jgi:hypothetical protein